MEETLNRHSMDRRAFLKGAGMTALAAANVLAHGSACSDEITVPYSSGSEPPKLLAPDGACDCHMHFYNKRYPTAPSATLFPPDAWVDDYKRFQKRIGTTRNVVVQPSTYGTDNRCTLDAVAQIGPSARAVAVVDTSVTDAELKRMAQQGVRGIRFNLVQKGATTVDMIEPLAKRVNELGWHLQMHMLGDQIVQIEEILRRLPTPIVFDHLARIPPEAGASIRRSASCAS